MAVNDGLASQDASQVVGSWDETSSSADRGEIAVKGRHPRPIEVLKHAPEMVRVGDQHRENQVRRCRVQIVLLDTIGAQM